MGNRGIQKTPWFSEAQARRRRAPRCNRMVGMEARKRDEKYPTHTIVHLDCIYVFFLCDYRLEALLEDWKLVRSEKESARCSERKWGGGDWRKICFFRAVRNRVLNVFYIWYRLFPVCEWGDFDDRGGWDGVKGMPKQGGAHCVSDSTKNYKSKHLIKK